MQKPAGKALPILADHFHLCAHTKQGFGWETAFSGGLSGVPPRMYMRLTPRKIEPMAMVRYVRARGLEA